MSRGFTLLEVTVVLLVLVLAAAIALPHLHAPARRLDEAARRLAETATLARERAILGGTPATLAVDFARARWTAADVSVALPAGVRFRDVVGPDGVAAWSGVVRLELDPAGDPLPARVDLADDRGGAASVVLPPGDGRAMVVRP